MMRREFSGGWLIVEPVAGDGFEHLSAEDLQTAGTIHSAAHRSEWLSWRNAVRRELGRCRLGYSPDGAPILAEEAGGVACLSVSHTRQSVAVIFSARRCGIDIESVGRNFERVATRYIRPDEQPLQEALGEHWRAILWCAKEAIFKWGRRTGVDFLHDVRITAADAANRCLEAEFFGMPAPPVHYEPSGDEILCYLSD